MDWNDTFVFLVLIFALIAFTIILSFILGQRK